MTQGARLAGHRLFEIILHTMTIEKKDSRVHALRPAIIIALLGVAFTYQLAWAWLATIPQILGTITVDDTFLYLQFARNTVAYGFPTFDGINLTNGVQPLWGGMLVLLAALIEDRVSLLRMTLTLCAILNLATGLALIAAAAKLKNVAAILVVGICWTCYMFNLSPSMLGMENSLHAFVAALILLCLAGLYARSSRPPWPHYLLLGFLLALNAGVRLDSAVISIVLGLAVMRQGAALGTRWHRSSWLVFGPMIVGACGFCLANNAYFGITLPVSGLAKAFYADQYLNGVSPWLWPVYVSAAALKVMFAVPRWLVAEFAPEAVQSILLGLMVALVAIPLILRIATPRLVDRPGADSSLARLCRVLMIAATVHLIALSVSILHFAINPWYHSWLLISWMIWLSWGLERWLRSPVLTRPAVHVLLTGLVLVVGLCQALVVSRQLNGADVQDLHVARLELSDWLNENLPPDTLLGSWNAGILAYFTDHTLVNLDGLMNSPDYVRQIQSGSHMRDVISDLSIDVVIDYNRGDSTMFLSEGHDPKETFRGIWRWCEVALLHVQPASNRRDLCVVDLRGKGEVSDEPQALPGSHAQKDSNCNCTSWANTKLNCQGRSTLN
jgi:hypothetical protein